MNVGRVNAARNAVNKGRNKRRCFSLTLTPNLTTLEHPNRMTRDADLYGERLAFSISPLRESRPTDLLPQPDDARCRPTDSRSAFPSTLKKQHRDMFVFHKAGHSRSQQMYFSYPAHPVLARNFRTRTPFIGCRKLPQDRHLPTGETRTSFNIFQQVGTRSKDNF